ncbi:MAG: hypothetical protein ACKVHT_03880 [Flavobacteriales bacterium]
MEFESTQQKNITEMGLGLYSPFSIRCVYGNASTSVDRFRQEPKERSASSWMGVLCCLVVAVWLLFFKQEV